MRTSLKGIISPCVIKQGDKVIFTCEKGKQAAAELDKVIDKEDYVTVQRACPKLTHFIRLWKLIENKTGQVFPKDWVLSVYDVETNPILEIKEKYKDYELLNQDYYVWVALYKDNEIIELRDLPAGEFPDTKYIVCTGPWRLAETQAEMDSRGYGQPMDVVKCDNESNDVGYLQGKYDWMREVVGSATFDYSEGMQVNVRVDKPQKREKRGDAIDPQPSSLFGLEKLIP